MVGAAIKYHDNLEAVNMGQRLIDANELPKLFDAEFKQTMKLIRSGEKQLDNLAEGFAEAIRIAKYIAPAVDAVPVVHGQWIFTKKHLWYKDEDGDIDTQRYEYGFCNGPECQICHESFCEHCIPDWANTECKTGHYYCSECAETSKDAHENYCPNCGAKMDLPKQTDDGTKKDGYGIGIYA